MRGGGGIAENEGTIKLEKRERRAQREDRVVGWELEGRRSKKDRGRKTIEAGMLML